MLLSSVRGQILLSYLRIFMVQCLSVQGWGLVRTAGPSFGMGWRGVVFWVYCFEGSEFRFTGFLDLWIRDER